jgi:beta-glucosidase
MKADSNYGCRRKEWPGGSATTGESVDSSSLDLMGKQEQLMREVFAVNQNMVILHTDGRPLCSEWAYENVPAIIEGWLPATYGGQAFAEVISGKYNPAGRTPFDVPRSAGLLPLYHYQNNGSSAAYDTGLISTGYIDSSSSALAPFGYGLSYTSFEYSDFVLKKMTMGCRKRRC